MIKLLKSCTFFDYQTKFMGMNKWLAIIADIFLILFFPTILILFGSDLYIRNSVVHIDGECYIHCYKVPFGILYRIMISVCWIIVIMGIAYITNKKENNYDQFLSR